MYQDILNRTTGAAFLSIWYFDDDVIRILCADFVKKYFNIKARKIEVKISARKFKNSLLVYIKRIGHEFYWSIKGDFSDIFVTRYFIEGKGNETPSELGNRLDSEFTFKDNKIKKLYISIKESEGK